MIQTIFTAITLSILSSYSLCRRDPNQYGRFKKRKVQRQSPNDTSVPEHEEDMSFENFQAFHDQGIHLDKFYVLRKAAVLYKDRDLNITRS
jgi:hypothetical protein